MKGIVFTEFLEMVESKFGYEMVDEMLTQNDLPSGGVYTAIGTYDHSEIVALVGYLHQKSQVPVATLLYTFGQHLFQMTGTGIGLRRPRHKAALDDGKPARTVIPANLKQLYTKEIARD